MELELSAEELRVLACLVEKSFTTPDQYPLTTNSLTNACNQKTSREPMVDYSAQLVDQTMLMLRDGGWARSVRGTGNRAFKHKHVIDERLGLSDAEQAVMAVLALRGPQSAGELRTRTERYGTFPADSDVAFADIEHILSELAAREVPLVGNVGRASGQSQDRWVHLLGMESDQPPSTAHPSGDDVALPSSPVDGHQADQPVRHPTPTRAPARPSASDPSVTIDRLQARIDQLEKRVDDLEELLSRPN